MEQTDKRVKKTKKAIRLAFISLLEKKEFIDITISELCEEADINRKTFYAHYSCTHDLLEEIEDDIVNYSLQLFKSIKIFTFIENPKLYITAFSSTMQDKIDELNKLSKAKSITDIELKIRKKYIDAMMSNFDSEFEDKTTAYHVIKFVISGVTALVMDWLNDQTRFSLDVLCENITKLIVNGIKPFLNKPKNR